MKENTKEPTIAQQNGIMYQIRQKYGVFCDTDSYKLSHPPLYPKNADMMVDYFEARGGYADEILWFGLRLIIKEYLLQRLTYEQADNMVEWANDHIIGHNIGDDLKVALYKVVDELDGRLPIRIRAAKEGSIIPIKNVLFEIGTSIPGKEWFSIISYLEAKLSRVWSPTTVATKSYHIRKIILAALEKSSDNPEAEIGFKLHDFGARGTPAGEAAAFAGAGHAVCFSGSDTTLASMAIEMCYGERMPLFSIPATEHSTTATHGDGIEGEIQLVRQMFDRYAKPGSIFATVIDTRDAIRFIREIAPLFKDELEASGAIWVFRPDSEHPVKMPVQVVRELDKVFGSSINTKGYKVLNNVGAIQGDGISDIEVNEIEEELMEDGYSATNMAFGMGGALLQKNDRDTHKFSLKACSIRIDSEWSDVYKSPSQYDEDWNRVDSSSFKTSKRGRHELIQNKESKEYMSILRSELSEYESKGWESAMELVYENGYMYNETTWTTVKRRAGTIL